MMDTMVDTAPRQSNVLPSIASLDSPKAHRDEEQSRRSAALPSPSLYVFGRETPSHHGQHGGPTGIITPPGSRRTSGEEAMRPALAESKLPVQPTTRQSLPSIHEALARDSRINYPGPPPPPPPPPSQPTIPTSTSSYFPHPSPTTATEGPKRDVASTYPPPPNQTIAPPPPPPPLAPPPPPNVARSNSIPDAIFHSQSSRIPSLQPIRTGNSPPTSSRPAISYPPPQQAPRPMEQSPQSAPPNATFYSSYQAQYPYQSTSSGPPSYPAPPAVMSAPPQYTGWPVDPVGKRELKPKSYDQSIKRRIDDFDLESSLYELAKYGGELFQYAEDFAKRAKDCKAIGDAPTKVVSVSDMDQLSDQIGSIQRAFARLQEAVQASHAELIEQQKEYSRQYPNMRPEQNGYSQEAQSPNTPMAPDPNKRKRGGRAAPPGRCHSCNRAETPEWRRGPDGARTLCNACGLHYAKLTRKMGPNAKAAISSSNLRPKV